MKHYVKVNGNLVEANRPEIKVFNTVQEAIDALANGEINEGEIFSTKFTDTGGGDTEENIQYLADRINLLSSYVPETTGVTNPLMNEAGVAAAIDSGDTGFLTKYCDSNIVANTNKLLAESTVDNKISNAINGLDVASVGGAGKYIKAIEETDGKISTTEETFDTAVTQNSTKGVSSGAVYTAIANASSGSASSLADEITARQNADTALDGKIDDVDDKISTNATSSDRCPSASEVTAEIATAISDITLEVKKALYPVGSIYMNGSSDTNPATLLGFGTWTRIQDYYLRASGTNATGSTGGSSGITLTENNMPQHNHTVNIGSASNSFPVGTTTGTMNQHASHNHTFSFGQSQGSIVNVAGASSATASTGTTDSANIDHTHSLAGISYSLDFGTKTSSSYGKASPDAIAITPEYKAVAVWQRTA